MHRYRLPLTLVMLLASLSTRAAADVGPEDGLTAFGFGIDGALGNYPLFYVSGRALVVRKTGLFVDASLGVGIGLNDSLYKGVQVDGVAGWAFGFADSEVALNVTVSEEEISDTQMKYTYYATEADAVWQVIPIVGTRTMFGATLEGADGEDAGGPYMRFGAGVQLHKFFREYFERGDHERYGFKGVRLLATVSPNDGYNDGVQRARFGLYAEYMSPIGLGKRQAFTRVFAGHEPSMGLFLGLGISVPLWTL